MWGPARTTGFGQVPDYYLFRADWQRREARRYGLPYGVRGMPGEGSIQYEWGLEVARLFEAGRALTLRDWRMLDPNTRLAILRSRRCRMEPETAQILADWR